MADIVNLRRFRKAKARQDKERQADENRRAHGLTKQQKTDAQRTQDEAKRHVDGHRLEDETDNDQRGE